jgi:large subunit ribosomal protein L10
MRMFKQQKVDYVKTLVKEISSYKTVAVMPIDAIPDRLLQQVRNKLKPDSKLIITKKSLISRALKGANLENMGNGLERNFAIVLSNKEPFELYKEINTNKLRLGAKPKQVAISDIVIEPGDTSIAPGQTVTELKSAGIDVQIQKGKVVIAKQKVLVEKGKKISGAIANALKILEIKPFEVAPILNMAVSSGLVYTEAALRVNEDFVRVEIVKNFMEAYEMSVELGIVTEYNVVMFITRAHRSAMTVGIEAKIPEPEIVKILVANAAAQASGINDKIGGEAAV